MFRMSALLLVVVAAVLQLAAADFELPNQPGYVRYEQRDPFKQGYFDFAITCFVLTLVSITCGFTIRSCCDKKNNRDSRSFFLVA